MPPLLRVRAACLAAVAFFSLASQASARPTAERRARVAASYLVSQQEPDGSFPGFSMIGSTADGALSLAAAKRGPQAINEAMAFLRSNVDDVDTIGLKAKVVMALVVAGANPRRFGGHNLVREIRDSQQPDGRFGADTPVLHHALAMLAIAAAGGEPFGSEADWLLAAQCPDGGWQFDQPAQETEDEHCIGGPEDFFGSETDATGYAVVALAGFKHWEPGSEKDPFAFFVARRDEAKSGWGYDASFPLTNANSTALVIEAYRDHPYRRLPVGAKRALVYLQYRLCGKNAGAFAYSYEEQEDGTLARTAPDVGATIGAILGLLPRPFDRVRVEKPVSDPPRC